jgi:large conductance mechanosensitive channel
MKGFKDFVLRGNLVELAVAFVIASSFALVVTATVNLLMDIVGKIGGTQDFSNWKPGGLSVGAWLTAVISFLVLAAVVYFAIVIPYQKAMEFVNRNKPVEEDATPLSEDTQLLRQIRDLLAERDTTGGAV